MFPVAFHAITLKESLREIAVVIINVAQENYYDAANPLR